jgi:hypothetical protein
MIDTVKNWILTFDFTSWMGFGLYWLPLSLCACGYMVRTWVNYQKDVAARDKAEREMSDADRERVTSYRPTDTVGTLIGRGIVASIPVANLWAACFDVAPWMLSSVFDWFSRVFDQPLVPKRKN